MELTQDLGDVCNAPHTLSSTNPDSTICIPKPIDAIEGQSSKSTLCAIEGDKAICENVKISSKNQRLKRHTRNRSFTSLLCSCWSMNSSPNEVIPKSRRINKFSLISSTKDSKSTVSSNIVSSSSSESHNTTQKAVSDEYSEDFGSKSPFSRLWNLINNSRKSIKSEDTTENLPGSSSSANTDGALISVDANTLKPLALNPSGNAIKKFEAKNNDNRQITLLGDPRPIDKEKKCFIIDLDETLVHSSFKAIDNADFRVGVEIDNIVHQVYVLKRPYVDDFLKAMSGIYECVLFTASLAKYADPVADFLDKWDVFQHRLFRESCVFHRGNYVKDLAQLGRPLDQVVILDNSPASYLFHATQAVQITSWFDDKSDRALLELIPYFQRLADEPNVAEFLRNNPPPPSYACVGSFDTTALNTVAIASSRSPQSHTGPIARLIKSQNQAPIPASTNTVTPAQTSSSIFSVPEISSSGNPISTCARLSTGMAFKRPISTPNRPSENANILSARSSSEVLSPPQETKATSQNSSTP